MAINLSWFQDLQLIVDFGLVVLIWMTQLIVYPSFLHYNLKNLVTWHQKYTLRIAIVVIPLMFLQLIIVVYNVFNQCNNVNIIGLFVVIFLWVLTFISFAPIHFKISEGKHNQRNLQDLIVRNWWRTFLWSALFLLNFMNKI